MTKVFTINGLIELEVKKALGEAGLVRKWVSKSEAKKLLPVVLLNKGIKEGDLPISPKTSINSKQLIKISDIDKYLNKLIEEGTIKLKQ